MIKLYGKTQSRTFRVLWMLEEMGQDYDHVDLLPHDPELCAIHPAGKVPVLVDGDVIVTDSTAILHYLADRYDARFTHPAGSARRAGQDSLVFLLLDEFDSCLWTAARHSFILPADYRVREVKRSLRWETASPSRISSSCTVSCGRARPSFRLPILPCSSISVSWKRGRHSGGFAH